MDDYTPITDAVLDELIKRPSSAYSNEVRDMAMELKQRREDIKTIPETWLTELAMSLEYDIVRYGWPSVEFNLPNGAVIHITRIQ